LIFFVYQISGVCTLDKSNELLDDSNSCNHETILDSVRGEYICTLCGLVLSKQYVPPSYKINPNNDLDSRSNGRHFVALGERLNIVDGLGSYMGFQFSSFFHDL